MKSFKILSLLMLVFLFANFNANASMSAIKINKLNTSTLTVIENQNLNNLPVLNSENQKSSPLNIFKSKKANDLLLLIKVVLCFILPPVAVLLHKGIGKPFIINLILTLLATSGFIFTAGGGFFLIAIIHALWVVLM